MDISGKMLKWKHLYVENRYYHCCIELILKRQLKLRVYILFIALIFYTAAKTMEFADFSIINDSHKIYCNDNLC